MRDREYERVKPAGTFRVAVVGDSIAAGWGVEMDERFESILERLWNDRASTFGAMDVEVINTAVPGHSPGQRWDHFRRVGQPLHPDLIVFEGTEADVSWDSRRLTVLLTRGLGWDSPLYRDALAEAGIFPGRDADEYQRRLRGRNWQVLEGVYRAIVSDCRDEGIPVILALVPRVGRRSSEGDRRRMLDLARQSGFSVVVDVSDAFDGIEPSRLAVSPNDYHPNVEGHVLLARRLDEALSRLPEFSNAWGSTVGTLATSRRHNSGEGTEVSIGAPHRRPIRKDQAPYDGPEASTEQMGGAQAGANQRWRR
jgi:hypothetical protein